MTPPAPAAVAIPNGATITARGRVTEFLVTTPRTFCDACVARALGVDPSTAYRVAVKIAQSGGFSRHYSVCSECGTGRLVTVHRGAGDRDRLDRRVPRAAPRAAEPGVSGTIVASHGGEGARAFVAPPTEEGRPCQQ